MPPDDLKIPATRWLTVLIGALCLLCPWTSTPLVSAALCLLLSLLVTVLIGGLYAGASAPHLSERWLLRLIAVAVSLGTVMTAGVCYANAVDVPLLALVTAMVVVLGVGTVLSPQPPSTGVLAVMGASSLLLVLLFLISWTQVADVEPFLVGGLDALRNGASPYAISVDDVYNSAVSDRFYGPEISQGGRVVYGYPYLPALLLFDIPGYLAGDVMWMHAAAMVFSLAMCWRLASDRLGRASTVMLALSPSTPLMVANYWVEPIVIAFLAITVWALHRGTTGWIIVGLGALFSSKQYAAYFLPSVWPVLRTAGPRTVASAAALAAVIVVSVASMDPVSFFRSAVSFQLRLPFREDAISFLPAARLAWGEPPAWLYVILPLVGFVVCAFVACRTTQGPTSFALCVGLGLLATVVFSKQSFANYFALIGAALVLAGITWPVDDPVQMREPSSQGSRGEGGISRTR